MRNDGARRTHGAVGILVGISALPYLLMTLGLGKFPGCPPESLEYPGHPAPGLPRPYSLVLIACIWAWFALWAGASVAVHRWLHARPERWLRVVSFVVPAVLGLGTPLPCMVFVGLATMC